MKNRKRSYHIIFMAIFFSLFISGCVNVPSSQVTPTATAPSAPTIVPSSAQASTITVTSYPASVDNETDLAIDWTVSGGTPGNIDKTAVIWGLNRSNANVSGYPEMSTVWTGTTPQQFNVTLKGLPINGTIYFRAYATVDGINIYSDEYQTIIVPVATGGEY
ncbi:MAG TPA: hypothetical protein VIO58_08100 [Candidatus Methanoperedens sp.]